MHQLLRRGLDQTACEWPPIRQAYSWVQRAADLLNNEAGQDVLLVRRSYRVLLGEMARHRTELGPLAPAVSHFRKVTRSYWRGLFRCYEQLELPRTNNELEQCFGSVRYQERRVNGRKGAGPGLVVRGRVRLVAAVVTQRQRLTAAELRLRDRARGGSCARTWRTGRK